MGEGVGSHSGRASGRSWNVEALRSCIESYYPILYLVTFEEEECDNVIRGLAGDRKVIEWNLAVGCVDFDSKRSQTQYLDLPSALSNFLDQDLDNHFIVIRDAHAVLPNNPAAVSRLRALVRRIVHDDGTVATVFLVSSKAYVAPELEPFITVFDQAPPEEPDIKELIEDHARAYGYDIEDEVSYRLRDACRGLSRYEIGRLLNRGYQRDGTIRGDDVDLVLDEKKQIVRKSGMLEMVSAKAEMGDIGGLDGLKEWLAQKAKVMARLPDAKKRGIETPKGMMIVGMPGCGKSLTAKATSALFRLPLLRLDVGALMGRYVGDSEANMRRALHVADTVSPCVLWVDEIEKAFAGIGGGNSGGSEVTSRLFGHFLTWMQEKTKPVFVVATANDISVLPPELLRKGRFDETFYVDFPGERERRAILGVHLRSRKMNDSGIDLARLASETDGFSGADLEGVVKDSLEQAFVDGKPKTEMNDLLNAIDGNRKRAGVMKDSVKGLLTLKEYLVNASSSTALSRR